MLRLPQSSADWKAALAEVKRDYLERKGRPCLRKSQQLLEHAKSRGPVEPAHLIYLHFYAASALELQFRGLHHASASRHELLKQAQDHYHRASVLAEAELETVDRLTRSSTAASCYSLSSGSSRDSMSTRMSSPTPTIEHGELLLGLIGDDDKEEQLAFPIPPSNAEPIVRPDSPTLGCGFDFDMPHESGLIMSHSKPVHLDDFPSPRVLSPAFDDDSPYYSQMQSLHRYSSAISFLHRQITIHLLACKDATPPPPVNQELRALDIRARVEKMRAQGWQRKRFDASRYEALREAALADLNE